LKKILRESVLLFFVVALAAASLGGPAHSAQFAGCNAKPTSPLVVNVKDRGAKGDGRTNDTNPIQKAIDEVAGTGGTVYIPPGTYMVRATGRQRLVLGSKMTLKMSPQTTLKMIPTGAKAYSILRIRRATDVTVTGGALQGDRKEHKGRGGEWGMGIIVGPESERVTIANLTARHMWGDGFYLAGGEDIAFCNVAAEANRRQGLSIIKADRVLVTNSVFRDTRGTAPSTGIDLEPNKPHERISNVRIEHSKIIDNAGGGILIAGKKGEVANVEILHNVFEGPRPILVENAPRVHSTSICENRHVRKEEATAQGFNQFADAAEVVSLQMDCRHGRDLRFEKKRQTKKKKPN
jgi:Pectate lyase superfamily protein/Right handed beta helix region